MPQFVYLANSIPHLIRVLNTYFFVPRMPRPWCLGGRCWDRRDEELGQEMERGKEESLQLRGEEMEAQTDGNLCQSRKRPHKAPLVNV